MNSVKNKIITTFKIMSLGANVFYGLKILFIWRWLAAKKHFRGNKISKLKLKKFGQAFNFYITDNSDMMILREIFLGDEYLFDLAERPNIIFDFGSNVGLSVIYFRLKYPKARIYAFEADPITFEKLKRNTEQFDDIYLFNLAVSGNNGKVKFYRNQETSMSSSLKQRLPDQEFIEIESKTPDTILEELRINSVDLLKFDIEGAEFDVFKNFINLNKVKNIIGEIHLDLADETLEHFLDLFKNFSVYLQQGKRKRYLIKASIKNERSDEMR